MRIALFATCIGDAMFPDVVKSTAVILTRLGHDVVFPKEQSCCGQMHVNTGYQRQMVPQIQNYVEAFDDSDIDAIVAPSGSCAGAVRHQHELVAGRYGSPGLVDGVRRTVAKTRELSEFLIDDLGLTDVGAYFPHRVTLHPTCHSLRVLHVGDRPQQLLRNVRGIDLVELPEAEECCGFGGTFAIKNAEVSQAMVTDKTRNVVSTGAEFVTAGDASCLMNIGGALSRQKAGVRAIHYAEILASTEEHPWGTKHALYQPEASL